MRNKATNDFYAIWIFICDEALISTNWQIREICCCGIHYENIKYTLQSVAEHNFCLAN